MAEDLRRSEPLPAPGPRELPPIAPTPEPTVALEPRDEPETIVAPPRDWRPAPFAGRFLLAYGLLGAVVGAAIIAFTVLAFDTGGRAGASWSTWKPNADGSARIREIALHVSSAYRLPSGRQLVAVIPRSPRAESVSAVVVDEQALVAGEQQYKAYPFDDGLMYFFCGFGEGCSIAEGVPSLQRQRMLRRQALELALYTFKYVDDVDSVLAFLPPRPRTAAEQAATASQQQTGQQSSESTAVFLRKDQLAPLLATPLDRTLLRTGSPRNGRMTAREAAIVDRWTAPSFYRYDFQRSPDGQSAIAVLTP